jgi:hypothetical protein
MGLPHSCFAGNLAIRGKRSGFQDHALNPALIRAGSQKSCSITRYVLGSMWGAVLDVCPGSQENHAESRDKKSQLSSRVHHQPSLATADNDQHINE